MSERRASLALRRLVAARARQRCEFCLTPRDYSASGFCVEHIIPASVGGLTAASNLALACAGCNGHKADKCSAEDSVSGHRYRLFHPRKDKWREHFQWSADGCSMEGKTGIGRATVSTLRLNRVPLLNLRRILILDGKHPPAS